MSLLSLFNLLLNCLKLSRGFVFLLSCLLLCVCHIVLYIWFKINDELIILLNINVSWNLLAQYNSHQIVSATNILMRVSVCIRSELLQWFFLLFFITFYSLFFSYCLSHLVNFWRRKETITPRLIAITIPTLLWEFIKDDLPTGVALISMTAYRQCWLVFTTYSVLFACWPFGSIEF